MKNPIYILLVFPFFIQGQTHSVDFITGIDYSFRILGSDNQISEFIVDQRDMSENARINFRLGVHYNFQFKERLHLRTGLRLVNQGYNGQTLETLKWPNQHDGQGGWDPSIPGEYDKLSIDYNYYFLELPFSLRHELSNRKLQLFYELGFAPSMLLRSVTKIKLDGETQSSASNSVSSTEDTNLQLLGLVSVGLNYKLCKRWRVFIQPQFRYHVTKLVAESIKEKLYGIGIDFGTRYKF